MEQLEQQMINKRLTQQRLDSVADGKWLEQEEMNIELPRSPVVRFDIMLPAHTACRTVYRCLYEHIIAQIIVYTHLQSTAWTTALAYNINYSIDYCYITTPHIIIITNLLVHYIILKRFLTRNNRLNQFSFPRFFRKIPFYKTFASYQLFCVTFLSFLEYIVGF